MTGNKEENNESFVDDFGWALLIIDPANKADSVKKVFLETTFPFPEKVAFPS